ncbi:hypothetical protein BC826DRAFT_906038 [Russula brevipes]|nr:hypothetical protein BC826DRAFT_906038 [Russula brevipes]
MHMDGWADHLHISFYGEHALFPGLRLTSLGTFITAAALALLICLAERYVWSSLCHQVPIRAIRQSCAHTALWRAGLYAVVTLLRLLYMLLSMTNHAWLILVIVLSLAAGQFFIEYYEQTGPIHPQITASTAYHRLPLPPSPPRMRRARGKTKPAGLFIHPNNSNLARADAVAVELGLHTSAERVSMLRSSSDSEDKGPTMWEHGRGRDATRALFGSIHQARTNLQAHSRSDPEQRPFRVGESGSESDD